MIVKAPAKVNLCLKVRRRRADGYHEIDTLFERVSICDELRFKKRPSGIRLKCAGRRVQSGPSNLVWRASELLRLRCAVKAGVEIRLTKRIPVAAGLGGGSSDAAAALVGLNRLWRLGLSKKTLLQLALELGSDVPFFVLGVSLAVGRGRGERLEAIRGRVRLWHVLAFPGLKVPTKEIYGGLSRSDWDPSPLDPARLIRACRRGDAKLLRKLMTNTLGGVCTAKHPALAEVLEAFEEEGALRAMVSGSGSTLFCLARSRKDAQAIARRMRRRFKIPFCVVSTY